MNNQKNIATGSGPAPTGAYEYFYGFGSTFTTWGFSNSINFNSVCAKFNSFIWVNDTIISSSDICIIKNIEDIIDDSALQKILNI